MNPYRADQVGSFLRPPELLAARAGFSEGKLSEQQLREAEDAAVLRVLELQKQSGIEIFSDGEYRRGGWASDFADSVDGYVEGRPAVTLQFQGGTVSLESVPSTTLAGVRGVIGQKLHQRRRLTAQEAGFLAQHAPGPYKVTMPAPSYVVARGYSPGITDKVYGSRGALLKDVAAIVRAEVDALAAEGVTYIQLDNPHYPDYIDADRQQRWREVGIDPEQALIEDIEADGSVFANVDHDVVTTAMHLCRGNGTGGAWHTSGGYEPIAEAVFGTLNVDRLLLEYDSARAGGFEPLRHVSPGKIAVLGLITTKAGALEAEATLLQRIEEASRYLPLEQLALSPQCGFASTLQGNPLTWEEQQRKLELVVTTAHKVWG